LEGIEIKWQDQVKARWFFLIYILLTLYYSQLNIGKQVLFHQEDE
tara:strand:+ start:1321 stop:1455 length:135 start_codon:yes stop_codon:yes gene_type:complete